MKRSFLSISKAIAILSGNFFEELYPVAPQYMHQLAEDIFDFALEADPDVDFDDILQPCLNGDVNRINLLLQGSGRRVKSFDFVDSITAC